MTEILINDIEPYDGYTAAGGETGYDYSFPIFDDDDLVVLEINTAGTVSTLVKGTDYTVSGVGGATGGSITFDTGVYPSGATAGYRYVLYRDLAVARGTDFLTGGDFKAVTMNRELDNIIMMIQQNERDIKRKVGLQLADAEDEINFEIETAANRADKLLIFGDDGNTIESVALTSIGLSDLDTLLAGLSDNDLLQYNSTSSVWENKTITAILSNAITTAMLQTDSVTTVKINSTVNVIGSIGGGTQDIDLNDGRTITATIDTATTTFTFSNFRSSGNADAFDLYITNGGSQTVNWPAAVVWEGGGAPSLTTSGVDHLVFTTTDGGTSVYGYVAGLDMS